MNQNIQQIRDKLEEKAEETPPYDEIDEDQLKDAVYPVAGCSDRTYRRYRNKMKELNILQEHPLNDEQETTLYKLNKRDKGEATNLQLTGEKKSVYLAMNKELVEKADAMNLNKAAVAEKALLDQISDMDEMIKQKIPENVDDEEAEFIYDLIIHDAYLDGKKDNLREELYIKQFDQYNPYNCQNLRRHAADIAENLGLIQKPQGL